MTIRKLKQYMSKTKNNLENDEGISGKCHICGKVGKLSFEHVPPKKALNSNKAFKYLGKDVIGRDNFPWDLEGIKRKQMQKGVGFNTLCEQCNNNTGFWYADSFVEFTRQGYQAIIDSDYLDQQSIKVSFRDIYPLRIIKEIVSMFFSINNPNLSSLLPGFRDFVLSKEKRGIPEDKYGFYIFALKGRIMRYIGLGGILYSDNSMRLVSELCAPPFGYVFEIEPKDKSQNIDITFFANKYAYNERKSINLDIPVREINSYLPLDYRTKDKIRQDFYVNVLHLIKSGFLP